MLIFLFISFLIIVAAYKNFRVTFIFYMALKMVGLSMMCIKYTPPALSMETLLNFFFLFEFFRRGYLKHYIHNFNNFPLKRYFILSAISIGLSSVFSIMPFSYNINTLILTFMDEYLLVIIFWFYINKRQDIYLFIKCSMGILLVSYIFGFYEFIVGHNPFLDYLRQNINEDLLTGKFYDPGERLGLRRVVAFFVSPNNFLYGAFVALLLFYYNKLSKYGERIIKHIFIFAFLSMALIIMANSRTVLISSIIIFIPILFSYKSQSIKIVLLLLLVGILFAPFIMQYSANITSVLSSSDKVAIEGSSISGRMGQFTGAFELMMKSPIIGNGLGSISYFVSDEGGWRWIILGTESVWMKLMIERGILGIIAYAFLFLDLLKSFKVTSDSSMLFCILGYLCAHTMSSLPGFSILFFLIVIFCMYKLKYLPYENRNHNNSSVVKLRNRPSSICVTTVSST